MSVLRLKECKKLISSSCLLYPKRNLSNDVANNEDYKRELAEFHKTYPILREKVLEKFKLKPMAEDFGKFMDWMVPCGRQLRATITLDVLRAMNPESHYRKIGENGLSLAYIASWIIEMYHSCGLIIDDVIDEADMRRGKVPWHKGREKFIASDLGTMFAAANDLALENFRDTPYYHGLTKLIHQEMGLDMCTTAAFEMFFPEMIRNKNVTLEFYEFYAARKSYYTSATPFKLGVLMALDEDVDFSGINELLNYHSSLITIMNDGLDYFDTSQTGKYGDEDIRKGGLTWFLVYVMQNASEEDVNFIAKHYGNKKERDIKKISDIFNKFELKKKYLEYEKGRINTVRSEIQKISNDRKLQDGLTTLLKHNLRYRFIDPAAKHV